MRRQRILTALSAVLSATAIVTALDAQQPRDGRVLVGTASLSGVVVTADALSTPVRRAEVEVAGISVMTDDNGQFSVAALPAGAYGVVARKPGFLPSAFGAKRAGGPGVAIEVRDRQQISNVRLKLYRGSVLVGLVADQSGQLAAGAEVRAFRYGIDPNTGERLPLPVTVGLEWTTTDDKGAYRLYGLQPGEYIVSAEGTPSAASVRLVTEDDIRYARRLLQTPPGTPLDPAVRRPERVMSRGQGSGLSVFHSSGESVAEATRVMLGVEEERQGVDVARRPVSSGIVKGSVSGPYATIREGGKVHLIDTASPLVQTRPWDPVYSSFGFAGVSPGHYEVVALSNNGGLLGRSEAFVIAGGEVALGFPLQPAATVSGRIVFQSTTGQPADPALVRVELEPAGRSDFPYRTSPLKTDGTFSWAGVPAGKYRLVVTTAPNLQPGWRASTAMKGGLDILDGVLDSAAPGEIVITLTDARSQITGTLQASDGTPVSDYSVLVFSADRAFWTPSNRRTQIVRPTSGGVFRLSDLPAGDYLMVALNDVEPGQWHSPAFLAELAPFGVKVTLADGEKKVQDLRLGGGG